MLSGRCIYYFGSFDFSRILPRYYHPVDVGLFDIQSSPRPAPAVAQYAPYARYVSEADSSAHLAALSISLFWEECSDHTSPTIRAHSKWWIHCAGNTRAKRSLALDDL